MTDGRKAIVCTLYSCLVAELDRRPCLSVLELPILQQATPTQGFWHGQQWSATP